MRRLLPALALIGLVTAACNGSNHDKPDGSVSLPSGPFPAGPAEGPPNAPLPPAMCGDLNGGGDQHVDFAAMMETKLSEKDEAMSRQLDLLKARYDLGDDASSLEMTRGKPVQQGVRVRLPEGSASKYLRTCSRHL